MGGVGGLAGTEEVVGLGGGPPGRLAAGIGLGRLLLGFTLLDLGIEGPLLLKLRVVQVATGEVHAGPALPEQEQRLGKILIGEFCNIKG